jgi:hypothetical protein
MDPLRMQGKRRMLTFGLVVILVVSALVIRGWVAGGDGGSGAEALPEPMSDALSEATAQVVVEWERPHPDVARETLDFLDGGEGAFVVAFVTRVAGVEAELNDAALADRCSAMGDDWNEQFPGDLLIERISGIGDVALGDTVAEQLNAVITMFDSCREGDHEQARQFGVVAGAWHETYQRRVDQLEDAR